MKNLFSNLLTLVVAFSIIFAIACQKDSYTDNIEKRKKSTVELELNYYDDLGLNDFDDEEENENQLIGIWKLIEVLADPGDGSGTFMAFESDKTIEFKDNGTVTTYTSLGEHFSEEVVKSGSFSLNNNTITTNSQNPDIQKIFFELNNQNLILNFISLEGYSQKFEKIN